jgi:subtilisin
MAQDKDERSAATRKSGEAAEESTRRMPGPMGAAPRATAREAVNGGNAGLASAAPARRQERYLIGLRNPGMAAPIGYPPPSMEAVIDYLNREPQVELVRRIRLRNTQPFASMAAGGEEVVVAKIDAIRAERLRAAAPPYLIIERDAMLVGADYLSLAVRSVPIGRLLPLRATPIEVVIRVLGERDQPLARAMVLLDSQGSPAQALTDDNGTARLSFLGGSLESVHTLFVRAASNHWDRIVLSPALGAGVNTVKLRPLSELHPNFPAERWLSWGQQLMRLEPTAARGSGVRIGLIDSGCDNSHPLLRHVTRGKDLIGGTESGWTEDPLAHGTHCAGVINAAATSQGIIGCVPEAELHVFKVLPEGHTSDLLAAIDECIERELDLINIGVVSYEFSELIAQKLQEARQKGIACIVAAGSSAGPLAFPAMLPGVAAVAAVGKLREFPADSSHALAVLPQLIGAEDLFAASFSAAGPQVALAAPGVAIVSTVPGGGYAAADGTSAAAAHVTGFAAVLLAQHPAFAGPFAAHSEQRVQALFELMRASAVSYVLDPQRAGAGVPDLRRVPLSQGLTLADAADQPGSAYGTATGRAWPPAAQLRGVGYL